MDDVFIRQMKTIIFERTQYVLEDGDPIFPIICCLSALSGAVALDVLEQILVRRGVMEDEIVKSVIDDLKKRMDEAVRESTKKVEEREKNKVLLFGMAAAFGIGGMCGALLIAFLK